MKLDKFLNLNLGDTLLRNKIQKLRKQISDKYDNVIF